MSFKIEKAVREKIWLRIALISPSGGGKTYSSLLLAKGIGGKTILIDTECRRSLYYADEFDFEIVPFDPPFSPERYCEAIDFAMSMRPNVLIIDSASHEWIGSGGILDIKEKMPSSQFKNDFMKWGALTPRHDRFIEHLKRVEAHLILNLRGKDEYVLDQKESGRVVPRKVGIGAQMRDGLEYECTVSLLIDQETHTYMVTKDNTHIFEGRFEKITPDDGKKLIEWAQSGKDPAQAPETASVAPPAAPQPADQAQSIPQTLSPSTPVAAPEPAPSAPTAPASRATRKITVPQQRRLRAIAAGYAISDAEVVAIVKQHGFNHINDITMDKYDAVCNDVIALKNKLKSQTQKPVETQTTLPLPELKTASYEEYTPADEELPF